MIFPRFRGFCNPCSFTRSTSQNAKRRTNASNALTKRQWCLENMKNFTTQSIALNVSAVSFNQRKTMQNGCFRNSAYALSRPLFFVEEKKWHSPISLHLGPRLPSGKASEWIQTELHLQNHLFAWYFLLCLCFRRSWLTVVLGALLFFEIMKWLAQPPEYVSTTELCERSRARTTNAVEKKSRTNASQATDKDT